MRRYNIKLAQDYINGNDIEGYTLEELENSKDFMKLVINITNDKNMYFFSSDNLKKNYDFVKFLIDKFKNKIDFICDVADYFLDNKEDCVEKFELEIIMSNILKTQNEKKYKKYSLTAGIRYISKKIEIEGYNIEREKDKSIPNVGAGFYLIYDEYYNNEIILNYFAKRMIDDILKENNINLEEIIHKNFKTKEQFKKFGINNYIINLIGCYDNMLSDYISKHLNTIFDTIKKCNKILDDFEAYEERIEKNKFNLIIEKVNKYMNEKYIHSYLDETFILYYVASKLGVFDKLVKYDVLDKNEALDVLSQYSDVELENILKSNFSDIVNLKKVENIFKEILSKTNIEELEDDYIIKTKKNSKIINFKSDFNTNNKLK